MSRVFDWLFQPPDQPAPDPDTTHRDNPMHHRSIFGEIDRVMQEMMREHFGNMNLFQTPNQHQFQLEDRRDEDTNIRDRMLKRPETERKDFHQNSFVPRGDIDLDNAVQNNPKLIDQFLDTRPSNQIQQQEFNQFPQLFGSHQNSPNNFTFSSQTVVVRRGPDGKLKYEKREIRQDSQGNREETVTSSDDRDSMGNQFLRNRTNQPLHYVPMGDDGVFGKIKNWLFPPNN